jgi:Ser/Thr protein kinase RdoA (MazF antagonist)
MSTPLPAHLAEIIQHHFDLFPPVEIELLRSYTNDVYLVTCAGIRYVLKVYGINWRSDPEIRFELELLDHLLESGLPVVRPRPTLTGHLLTHLELDGQHRQAVLFDYAPGGKPTPPFTLPMYHRQGAATAALHLASETFTSRHHRRPIDTNHLIRQPIALLQSLPVDRRLRLDISDVAARLEDAIGQMEAEGLAWGICHGDVTFDNVHLTADGTTIWYDFDSGGFGWQAIDLQGWAAGDRASRDRQGAFLAGYQSVRPIAPLDVAASPYLYAAQLIWGMQVDLERRVRSQGLIATENYLNEIGTELRRWAAVLGLNRA